MSEGYVKKRSTTELWMLNVRCRTFGSDLKIILEMIAGLPFYYNVKYLYIVVNKRNGWV